MDWDMNGDDNPDFEVADAVLPALAAEQGFKFGKGILFSEGIWPGRALIRRKFPLLYLVRLLQADPFLRSWEGYRLESLRLVDVPFFYRRVLSYQDIRRFSPSEMRDASLLRETVRCALEDVLKRRDQESRPASN